MSLNLATAAPLAASGASAVPGCPTRPGAVVAPLLAPFGFNAFSLTAKESANAYL